MKKVFAVIITYNRQDLLKRCLGAVYAQTRPCDGVIVIDNASQDNTRRLLLESGYPNLTIHTLSRNIGASGGFNVGFRLAYQSEADFIWVMDDDVIPKSDALQCLLKKDEELNNRNIDHSYLLSTAFTENGHVTNTPSLSLKTNKIGYLEWPEMIAYGIAPVRRATFVSILLPRSTLTEHGLPIASMFIWGEDTEYTLRITQEKPGFLVGASEVIHLRQENGPISILSESNPSRLRYHEYYIRNKIFISRIYSVNNSRLMSVIYGVGRLFFKLLKKREFCKAKIVLQGVLKSVFFFPHAEAADAPIANLNTSIKTIKPEPSVANEVVLCEELRWEQ
ncbi:glycosyltransferase family 2 protein [Halomonas sp. M20]|uniref:glycosyltransferase family 2 protein n=1 Tax=Halomonas sp. M20 TaxID=2763264 RepID=UPI001D0B58BF|nr:glycosyltransferase family 2 protein [Halomonas sp. M20]